MYTKNEISSFLVGQTIEAIYWRKNDSFGKSLADDDLVIEAIEFASGIIIEFEGSPQIGRDEVTIKFRPPILDILDGVF